MIERHRRAGRPFEAAGIRSFVREEGAGEPVVCVHGVPSSCFLWRKVLPELAARGLRGVALDLPGLGLAERRRDIDYTWTGLGRFCAAAVDALELDRFHLVVHDIGGPIGFELAAAMPDRIRSLTVMNAMVEVDTFKRPWYMEPFARPGLGELWLAGTTKPALRVLLRWLGIADRSATSAAELDAYFDLLKREDGGRAFLRIMRGFERTRAKRELYVRVLGDERYPRQVVWGELDATLPVDRHGENARRAAGVERIHRLPAKHFLQEDQAPAVAERIAALAGEA